MSSRTIFAAAAAAFALVAAGQAGAADTVKVAQGTLHGATAGQVTSFKGVPFAAPPVGDLRWRPPQAPKAWTGTREAIAYGHQCMQMRNVQGPLDQDEDCLTLNVWTPAGAKPGQKLPVMVWIHGGSFTSGSGANALYDGTHFAERGVVLVTVNYRLGRLGFFAHPALSAEQPGAPLGSYGIMDQIAALKWVKANVAQFGGDPNNVTAFGESAGGIAINFLMTSPQAQGLFNKAISESGFGRFTGVPIRGASGRTAEKDGLAYASAHGVTGTGADAMKALRALSAAELSKPNGGLNANDPPQPIIDGVVVTDPPAKLFAEGKEAKVPYIAGGNSWEASLFPQSKDNPEGTLGRTGPLREKIVAAYGGPSDLAGVSQDFTTENSVIEPDRHLARLHAKNGQKAWVYYWSYIPASQRSVQRGMGHGGELGYVFGNLPDQPRTIGPRTIPAATADDRAISAKATDRWVAFAKTGQPGPDWPTQNASDPVLEFGADGVQVRPNFHKATLDVVEQGARGQ
jgi:para-nitrobenzyl esterase